MSVGFKLFMQLKRVANQTKGGKKRTVSCLVVVGNGNGLVGKKQLV